MAIQTETVATTFDGCTLTETYDDATYDANTDSYKITSVTANNPTGTNGFRARAVTVWAIYKGQRFAVTVPAGQSKSWTPTGNRSIADVSGFGLS